MFRTALIWSKTAPHVRIMVPPAVPENDLYWRMEGRNEERTYEETENLVTPGQNIDSRDVHKRNLSTVASPVVLLFDGFHNLVYHLYLATRWGSWEQRKDFSEIEFLSDVSSSAASRNEWNFLFLFISSKYLCGITWKFSERPHLTEKWEIR